MNAFNSRVWSDKAGFTLIELQVVMAILLVIASTSMMFTKAALPSMRADGQARRLVALFHIAREAAIATRRDHEVRFDTGTNTVQLIKRDAGVEVLLETFVFEFDVVFTQFPGLTDTPAGYGDGSAVDFGNSTTLLFDSEGSFIDETGLPANGTVFVGIPHVLQSARAITVTGTTGRPRLYRWRGTGGGAGGGGAWTY
jgi:prepilin-type N-terminal cleavage/methylation domain-containing protein